MGHTQQVLLVEDNQNDVELMLTVLEDSNLAGKVVVARDGVEALDYLFRRGKFATRDDGTPTVVLLDINMPKINGLEVLRQVRADAQLQWLPVVMLTSSRVEQDIIKSYELGANAYVVKPVDFEEYVKVVKEIGNFWSVRNELPPGSGSNETAGSQ